ANPGGVYNMVVTAGTLPPGVQFSSNPGGGSFGFFSGTPSQAGTYNFTVKATKSGTCSTSQNYSLTINCPTITLDTTLPNGTAGVAYSKQLTILPVEPNEGNYTLATIQGNLPP